MAITTITQSNEITVAFEELDGSPREGMTDQGFEATRELLCAWDERLTLAQELKGGVFVVEDDNGNQTVVRCFPHRYPHKEEAVVRSVGIARFGRITGDGQAAGTDAQAEYGKALLTVAYGIPEHGESDSDDEETLVSESLTRTAEFLTLPEKGLFWDTGQADPLAKDDRPGLLTHTTSWTYTRHKVIKLPSGTISLVGKVNDSPITSKTLGFAFPAETLLYGAPILSRDITTDGVKAWRVEFHFQYKPHGWNKFYKEGSQTPQKIYDASGDQVKPYEPKDFGKVL